VEGAPSVAGLVSAAAGVSVLVAVGSVVVVVFFFLEKRDFSLSRGDSGSRLCVSELCQRGCDRVLGFYHTAHVDSVYWRCRLFDGCVRRRR
jgi:hypothetical protein